MLALLGRAVSGSLVVDARALDDTAALVSASVPCQSEPDAPSHQPGKPLKHRSDQGIVSLASFLAQPSLTLSDAVAVPPPNPMPLGFLVCLSAIRGPPACASGAALPRGPPVPI